MSKILLTGRAGFIGERLASALSAEGTTFTLLTTSLEAGAMQRTVDWPAAMLPVAICAPCGAASSGEDD
jgi:nucleoside-diphosphate-sugar epimerase